MLFVLIPVNLNLDSSMLVEKLPFAYIIQYLILYNKDLQVRDSNEIDFL